MKIIDAHLHYCLNDPYFDGIAKEAGHVNSGTHLREEYKKHQIQCGIVMGNRGLEKEQHQYPDYLRYCIGLDSHYLGSHKVLDSISQLEWHLQQKQCVGIKLYPGYNPAAVTDPSYEPVYELAQTYKKVVAVHTGETAGPAAILKYSHPLTVDEAAVRHPGVQFVMCHFGNPWLADAAAVVSKNHNVAADLSGILEGMVDINWLMLERTGYVEALRTWLGYVDYRDVMFGTDWPLVNLGKYIEFIMCIVPERNYDNVFFDNAVRIYQLELERDRHPFNGMKGQED